MGLREWFKCKQQSKNNDTILLYFVAFDERTTHFKLKKKNAILEKAGDELSRKKLKYQKRKYVIDLRLRRFC